MTKNATRPEQEPSSAFFQINFCKRNPMFMDSVRLGALNAIEECQFQFQFRRWNCSTLAEQASISHQSVLQFAHLDSFILSKNGNES